MKRGLVLSGGGALGAYEVGALEALAESGRRWDVISGVSVGSINGYGLSMLEGLTTSEQVANLKDLWKSISNKDVYKKHAPWFLNYIWSFWKKSIYSMKPLEEFVLEKVDDSVLTTPKLKAHRVPMYAGVVHIQTGKYHSVRIDQLPKEDAVKIIHASSVFPGLFEPVELGPSFGVPKGEYVDGGIRDTVPLRSIIGMGLDEIDVIITSPRDGHVAYKEEFKSAIDVGLRAAFIMSDEVMLTDRIQGICQHNKVKFNLYAPSAPLRFDGFQFTQDAIGEMLIQGYQETKSII